MKTHLRRAALLASTLLVAPPAASAESTYADLIAARPEAMGYPVDGVTITRDAFRVELTTGSFFPLKAVGGRVLGGVFVGKGAFELVPASESERRNLALSAKDKELQKLRSAFEQAVFLFSDGTLEELKKDGGTSVSGTPNELAAIYEKVLKAERKTLRSNLHLRLYADLLENRPPDEGVFELFFDGEKLPPALATYDPRGLAASGFDPLSGTETTNLVVLDDSRGGSWYSSVPKTAAARPPAAAPLDVDAIHYTLETRIKKNKDLESVATIRLRAVRPGMRVLRPVLFPRLRVKEAALVGEGEPENLTIIQGKDDEDGDLALVAPRALSAGEEPTLIVAYGGDDVLEDQGGGNYSVNARTSWYPNFGAFTDTATYDLTYRVPKKNQLVSVGELEKREVEADVAVYRYAAKAPIRVAGFNYGEFGQKESVDKDSGLTLRVYTNKEASAFARELQDAELVTGRLDPESFAQSALADGINAARVGTHYFGPLPGGTVSITQQTAWNFGQSWPSLIFLPFIAFMSSMHRVELGLMGASDFVYHVGYHELAHQWWGHQVGWATYRDQWLSEGFAEFSTSLAVQATEGPGKFKGFWEHWRKTITEKNRGGHRPYEVGPIHQGYRLADADRAAAQAVMYGKGAFVVHMLRTMLYEGKAANKDERFIAAMKDFTSTWAGRSPTSDDFRRVIEKHLPPSFGSDLSWFFDQWVYGTAIPKLAQKLEVKDLGGGKYRLEGEVSQSEVPETFKSVIPIYLELDKNQYARLGQAILVGTKPMAISTELALPKKPRKAVANVFCDWLVRD